MEQQSITFQSVEDSYKFLKNLGASPHLMQHVKLVGEASELLILQFQQLDISFDSDWIRLGVVFQLVSLFIRGDNR
jgi:hypothetical protein